MFTSVLAWLDFVIEAKVGPEQGTGAEESAQTERLERK